MQEIDASGKVCDWKFTANLTGSFFYNLQPIINRIRAICFSYEIDVEILKSGWFIKHVEFLFHGRTTEKIREEFKKSLDNYFLDVNNTKY